MNEPCLSTIYAHFKDVVDPRQRSVSSRLTGLAVSRPALVQTGRRLVPTQVGTPRAPEGADTHHHTTKIQHSRAPKSGRGKRQTRAQALEGVAFQRCTGGLTAAPVQQVKERERAFYRSRASKTERLAAQAKSADPALSVVMSFICVLYPQGSAVGVQPANLGDAVKLRFIVQSDKQPEFIA